jgi:gentisate 1,2-dioxygenase
MSDIRAMIKSKSKDLSLVGLWDVVNQVELAEPVKSYQPHIWYWRDLRPLMLEAGKNIPLSEADRRVMILSNPSVYPKHYSTNTLYVSCSIYNAGETAPVHRHTPSASRFVLEGDGGYTNIEGEKCLMSRGDLIITPNGTWHDHGNEGTTPVLWVDVLDLPLVEMLGATQFEFNMEEEPGRGSNSKAKMTRDQQPVNFPVGHSTNLYATGGLTPTFVSHARGRSRATPMLLYRWEDTERALNRLRDYEGSPYDGVILEYTNPLNGEPVTTTMSFLVQLLRRVLLPQGQGQDDRRRSRSRMGTERHVCGAELGLARARERQHVRRCGTLLGVRCRNAASPRALSRGGRELTRQGNSKAVGHRHGST